MAASEAPNSVVGRLLGLAGDADPELRDAKLIALSQLLLLYAATRAWAAALRESHLPFAWLVIFAVLLSGCAAAALLPRWRAFALRLALLPLLGHLALTFPLTDNHFYLELLCVGLLVWLDADRALLLQALQWTVAIVLFHTGLQKLLWGTYWHGDFLAYMVATGSHFGDLFLWILPGDEVARLRALPPWGDGAGPYRVDSLWLRLGANAVVWVELGLPFLLIWRRTRTPAAVAAVVFVLGLQLSARELLFATLFSLLLLSFPQAPWLRRARPVYWLACALLLALALGWIPSGGLLRGGHL
ncbi:MAG: hypothetical protein MJE66_00925 [Proteobacteria bacterium]|nr:hypothetical protein [Pseudomonadota bacterium]